MASKRRNMFQKNKTQEPTENEKRRRQRSEETAGRRREYHEMFGTSSRPFSGDTILGVGRRSDSKGDDLLSSAHPMAVDDDMVFAGKGVSRQQLTPPSRIFDDI
ncbi:hypothetical protein AAG570_000276 [Ranatra chinensis]|uniref:Uncharacterized protein n=1 Tax=Ranatra chinensis TaxID=642074 RepID=A0ABD0YYQ8_9HEMI